MEHWRRSRGVLRVEPGREVGPRASTPIQPPLLSGFQAQLRGGARFQSRPLLQLYPGLLLDVHFASPTPVANVVHASVTSRQPPPNGRGALSASRVVPPRLEPARDLRRGVLVRRHTGGGIGASYQGFGPLDAETQKMPEPGRSGGTQLRFNNDFPGHGRMRTADIWHLSRLLELNNIGTAGHELAGMK